MSLHIVNFEPEHLLFIQDVSAFVTEEQKGLDLLELGKESKRNGPCLTLVDKEVIACGGIWTVWPETAEIWLRLSESHVGHEAAAELREQMFRWIEEGHFNRMQAHSQTRWEKNCKFLSWLGMQREGTLRKFGPHGLDQEIYAWVRP